MMTAHDNALQNGGGVPGINNEDLIRSALGRPYHEYAGHVFYPSVTDKAGCLLHGFLTNHGFKDANKRTAWIVCNAFLYTEIYLLILPEDYPWYDKLAQMVHEHWDVQRVISWVERYAKGYESHEAMMDDVEIFFG
nr:Fic family protein [uncultured Tateyamaria sp.]